mmetsp:Transcript_21928/g.58458  ORF Transcript_21928/g.58458 Transcript_21928/m.58458 type:complete len:433 (+) Transcript_21928:113-1411(+)
MRSQILNAECNPSYMLSIICLKVSFPLVLVLVLHHGACKLVSSWRFGLVRQSNVSGQSSVSAQRIVFGQDMERVRNVTGQSNVTSQSTVTAQKIVTGQGMERVRNVTGQGIRAWPRPLTVFYHVFEDRIKKGGEALTTSIVNQQLSKMRASGAFDQSVKLKWTFIGPRDSGVPALLQCPTCQLVESSETGNEIVTLQHLYDYCSKHHSDLVVYMHTKGAYHACLFNNNLRRFLMKGIWSDACHSQDMFQTCTACGSRFSPMPHQHYPGNMWLARCDYISRLTPPLKFESTMLSAVRAAMDKGVLPKGTDHGDPGLFGLGRFSAEHWLGSHPSHAPCDVCDNPRFTWNLRSLPAFSRGRSSVDWAPKLRPHPRPDMPLAAFCKSCRIGAICNLSSLRSWRLFEWKFLHPESEPQKGALWEYYSAGEGSCMNAG